MSVTPDVGGTDLLFQTFNSIKDIHLLEQVGVDPSITSFNSIKDIHSTY